MRRRLSPAAAHGLHHGFKSKCFMVPCSDIPTKGYDLSVSRHKINIFKDVAFDSPVATLDRLTETDVGAVDLETAGVEEDVVMMWELRPLGDVLEPWGFQRRRSLTTSDLLKTQVPFSIR